VSGEGFLSRWSRRKRQDAAEEAPKADDAPPPQDAVAPPQEAAAPQPTDSQPTPSEEELAALPPIETIDENTDISGFLRKGVPAALKNAALRRAWAVTPAVRDYLDPARDYAYDWNVPGGVPGDGPLAPGFDAKALADRLFAGRKTKVVEDECPSPDGQNTDDEVSRTAGAGTSPTEPEGNEDPDRAAPGHGRADGDGLESSAAYGVAARAPAAPHDRLSGSEAKNASDISDFRPRPRRHGGATPV